MNSKNNDKFRQSFLAIAMTDTESNAMKEQLRALTIGSKQQEIPSPYVPWRIVLKRSLSIGVMSMLALAVLSQPASAKSLPGELLYPVKIIHEEIVATTKQSPEAKIIYETIRTERRIQEATELARTEQLTVEQQVVVAEKIKKHTKRIHDAIVEVTEQDPLVALEFNAKIEEVLVSRTAELRDAIAEHPIIKELPTEETAPIILATAQGEVTVADEELSTTKDDIILSLNTNNSTINLSESTSGVPIFSGDLASANDARTITSFATTSSDTSLLLAFLDEGIKEIGEAKELAQENVVVTVIEPISVDETDILTTLALESETSLMESPITNDPINTTINNTIEPLVTTSLTLETETPAPTLIDPYDARLSLTSAIKDFPLQNLFDSFE